MLRKCTVAVMAAAVAVGWPAAAAAEQAPHLELQPDEVQPGGSLQVVGTCGSQGAGQSIQIVVTGALSGQIARTDTDAVTGDFDTIASVGEGSPEGTGTVVAGCGLGEDDPRAELTVSADATPAGFAPVARGETGLRVAWWQDRLNEWLDLVDHELHPISVDGIFGPETETATLEFQRWSDRLEADATVEPTDRVALRDAIEALEADQDQVAAPVERGDRGELVAWWQEELNEWLLLSGHELHPIAVDAIFGPETEGATLEFQEATEGLEADGVVGPGDRVALESYLGVRDDPGEDPADEPDTEAVDELTTDARQSDDFPALGTIAQLIDIRTGVHEGFERIVFDFAADGDVEYRVRYLDEPPVDIPGDQVEVEGAAMLEIRLSGASGVDLSGPEAVQTYTGPDRFSPDGHEVIQEIAVIDDFEGDMGWLVGLESDAPFAVAVLEEPLRLVVDIAR